MSYSKSFQTKKFFFLLKLEGTKTRLEHQICNNYRKNRDRINTVKIFGKEYSIN